MGKSIVEETKQEIKNEKKEANSMNDLRKKETFKTIVITILSTGIICFALGMYYQQNNANAIHAEAKSLASSVQVAPSK